MKTKYHVLSDVTVRFRYVRGQWQASHGFDGRSYVPVPDAARDDDDDGYPEEDVPSFDAHPIVAGIDVPERGVQAGDLGGLLQEGARLAQGASCWVYPDSVLGCDASVSGGAAVGSPHPSHRVVVEPGCHLRATDNARIMGRCRLSVWHLDVGGDAVVDGGDYGVSMDGRGSVRIAGSASLTHPVRIDCDGVLLVCDRARLTGCGCAVTDIRVDHIAAPRDGAALDHAHAVAELRRSCKSVVEVRDDAVVESSRIYAAMNASVTIGGTAVVADSRIVPDGDLRIGGRTMMVRSTVNVSGCSLSSDVAYIGCLVRGEGEGVDSDGDADIVLPPDCTRRVAFQYTIDVNHQ